MSKTILFTLMAAIALIILAVIYEMSFVAGGSGVIFVVGLVYAYEVAKREVELLNYAVKQRDEEQGGQETSAHDVSLDRQRAADSYG